MCNVSKWYVSRHCWVSENVNCGRFFAPNPTHRHYHYNYNFNLFFCNGIGYGHPTKQGCFCVWMNLLLQDSVCIGWYHIGSKGDWWAVNWGGITSSGETWDCLKSGLTEAALSWVEKLWDKKKIQKLGPRERVTGCNIRIAIKYQKAATISSDRISLWSIMPPPLPVSQEGISQLHDQLIIMGSLLFSSTSHLVSVESCLRFFTGILALRPIVHQKSSCSIFFGKEVRGEVGWDQSFEGALGKFVGSWRHFITWCSAPHRGHLGRGRWRARTLPSPPAQPPSARTSPPSPPIAWNLHFFTHLVKAQVKLC